MYGLSRYVYVRLRWICRGQMAGLRESISALPRNLRRDAWVESHFRVLPRLTAGNAKRDLINCPNLNGRRVFGGLHFRVATERFVFDYYQVRRRNGSTGDAMWVTHCPNVDEPMSIDENPLGPQTPLASS